MRGHKEEVQGRQAGGRHGPAGSVRPRVICHMMTSLDGRIVVDNWPLSDDERSEYEQVHESHDADGWLVGRVTMEQHFAAGARSEAEVARRYDGSAREDFIAPGKHESFAIAVDPRGKLVWESGEVEGDHIVAVLTHSVSDEYLEMLRERGVSFILAGRESDVDLPLALEKIGARLGIRTLMLEGGGGINGSFLRAGLVDELSLLVAPVVDGRIGTPALFDIPGRDVSPRRLTLDAVERRSGDMILLRYRAEESDRAEG